MWLFTSKTFLSVVADKDQPDGPKLLVRSRVQGDIEEVFPDADVTEPPPTKVEGFSGLERLRRTVGSFPTEVGGFKPDFWKMIFEACSLKLRAFNLIHSLPCKSSSSILVV